MDEDLTQIETQLAFLDKNMSELSKVVFEQQKQIDELRILLTK